MGKKLRMESAGGLSKAERRKQGKALRDKCPRKSQAEWELRSKSKDIIELLEESDADRITGLIPVKYQRMGVSPFTFFRGAAVLQARDLASAPVSGITVQACGDCHLAELRWLCVTPNVCWCSTSTTLMKRSRVHGNGTSSDWGPASCWQLGIVRFSKHRR